ncbi:ImmA/IrrE family metallo-endopeptidase [Caproiciproducens faecalis]|uniref:ImmA/IrrE family metallo-endopeptidase n=1 Tax=Caproiciproducens faecalis TaxID=2820301 RepID=A0ABS7DRF8_9FIRM|nr:ImmA/IrrE family metallo-endopeptidase [Caproiciproducens faecalis]MBW7573879.1 ImmA/IrrE family metallo-endopeptidase [Caproiciproducens faecalis]
MTELSKLYSDLDKHKIKLFTKDIGFADAATIEVNGEYGIFLDLACFQSIKSYKECLAHELGHCATGCTHKVSSPLDLVAKHEYKANRWAIERYVPFEDLQAAFMQGYSEIWQLAEYFDLPESFIKKVVDYYFIARDKKIG